MTDPGNIAAAIFRKGAGHRRLMVAIALEGLAEIAGLSGHHRDAAALWGYSHRLREMSHIAASGSRNQELHERLHLSEDAIGTEALQLEIERGEHMDLHEALDLATQVSDRIERPAADCPLRDQAKPGTPGAG
jgi:hypothetical protein